MFKHAVLLYNIINKLQITKKEGNSLNKSVVKNTKKSFIRALKNSWQLYLLIVIPLLFLILFKYLPMYGAQIAFRQYNPIDGFFHSKFVGFKHFRRFFSSPLFPKLMINTLSLSFYSLVLSFPIPILLAISLNYANSSILKKASQMISYAPYFISVVVMIGIISQMFNVQYGSINTIIHMLGGKKIDVLGNPNYFRMTYVLSGIWQNMGFNSIIYISALSSISPEIHEAAIVDGATKIKTIRFIDIPSLIPTAITLFIIQIGSFMSTGFEKAFLLQNDLNISVSEVIDTYVYKIGLSSQMANFSYSTAIGLFQSIVGFILVVMTNQIAKRVSDNGLW